MVANGSLVIVLAVMPAATSLASTYYASPAGGGDGRSETAPFQIADFWQQAKPGDALLLLDGRYTGEQSMIRPPQGLKGAPNQPITVKALHDGRVEIDGENRRKTVLLYQNTAIISCSRTASERGTLAECARATCCSATTASPL